MSDTKTDWYFIVNPRAGSGKTMSKWVPAEQKLQKLGIGFVTVMTDHKKHATSLAEDAARLGYRRIMAVGGDGSLHEVMNGICNWCDESGAPTEDFTIGVMPIGSGNDWIKSMGLPHDFDAIISILSDGTTGQMDVVKVRMGNGSCKYMANIGGTGFDSHVCSRVNIQKESGKRSKLIYLDGLRYTMTHISSIRLKVIADGAPVFEGDCYSVALGNGCYSGGGMRQVPLADPCDGILDYMVVPKLPLGTIARQIPRLFSGNLHKSPDVISGRCKSLQIVPLDSSSEDIVELDGEIEGRLPLSIEMEPRKIRVIKTSPDTEA